jgi:hypothetical protein
VRRGEKGWGVIPYKIQYDFAQLRTYDIVDSCKSKR